MSVLDQAFIRAYGKDETELSAGDVVTPTGHAAAEHRTPAEDASVHWYGDAKWYRADAPEDSGHESAIFQAVGSAELPNAQLNSPESHPGHELKDLSQRLVEVPRLELDVSTTPEDGQSIAEDATTPQTGPTSEVRLGGSHEAAQQVDETHHVQPASDESQGEQLISRPHIVVDTSSFDELLVEAPTETPDEQDVADSEQPTETTPEAAWVLPPVLDQSSADSADIREDESARAPIRVDAGGNSVPTPHLIVEPAGAVATDATSKSHGTATQESESRQLADSKSVFSPAWEVDRLRWPAICQRLTTDHRERLALIGEKLLGQLSGESNMIAVTSCRNREGCTTVALCLAKTLATNGARVLLVDGNFESPGLATSLGLDVPLGWNDAIADRCPLAEATILSLDDKLTILPLKQLGPDAAACWSSPRAGQLLRFASNLFDLILVDCGPLENKHSSTHLTDNFSLPERALLVRDVRNTLLDDVHHVVRRLQTVGIETVGIAENFGETAPEWSIA